MYILRWTLFGISLTDLITKRVDECDDVIKCDQVVELQNQVSYLQDGLSLAREMIGTLQTEVESLKGAANELEYDMVKIEKEVDTLQGDVTVLEDVVFPGKIAASCSEYASRGESSNGKYVIRPSLQVESFEVICDFRQSKPGGKTILEHDHGTFGLTSIPGQSDGCKNPGCYAEPIVYNANMQQITELINISADCRQTVTHNCTNNGLTGQAWWVDRTGFNRQYWHGGFDGTMTGCFCHLEGSGCSVDSNGQPHKCNCDANGEQLDEGILSHKDQLPIVQLNYGGSEGRYNWILYMLGFLECSGKSTTAVYPSELSQVDYLFKYYASTTWTGSAGSNIIMSEKSSDDSHGSYDSSTGIFHAPTDGRYEFSISLYTHGTKNLSYLVQMKVDDKVTDEIQYANSDDTFVVFQPTQLITEVDLVVGQKVHYYVAMLGVSNYLSYGSCHFNNRSVGCSFIQGKLLNRY